MNSYSRMMSAYVRIWAVASIINAVISTVLILSSWNEAVVSIFFLTLVCSFLFSIPILLAAMMVAAFLISLKTKLNEFQLVLVVTFFVTAAGAWCFFKGLFEDLDRSNPALLCMSVVVSAVTAVIICRKKLIADITIEN